METANNIIIDALQELLIQASEAPIEADEAKTAIRYLNRMMFEYEAQGIALGYTEIDNLADYVSVSDGAVSGIVTNLAIRLASQYQKQVPPSLVQSAKDGLNAMRKLGVTIVASSLPPTMPIGSGNECDGYTNSHFYPDKTV